MKKILFLTLLSLLVNCLVSCDNSSITKIKQGIAEGNKDCPLDLGMIGVLQSMTFNDDTKCVEWLCVVNEEVVLLDMMKNNVEDVRRNLEAFITNGAYKSTMKMMADAGVGLTMTYRWASTNDDIPFVFTSDDILKLFDNPLSDQEANMMKLRSVLTSENDNCPYAVEQGLVMQQEIGRASCRERVSSPV